MIAGVESAGVVKVDAAAAGIMKDRVGKPVTLGIRAENIQVLSDSIEGDTLKAHVLVVEPLGSHDLLTCRMGDEQLKVATRPDMHIQTDQEIHLQLEHERTVWLDPETNLTIAS